MTPSKLSTLLIFSLCLPSCSHSGAAPDEPQGIIPRLDLQIQSNHPSSQEEKHTPSSKNRKATIIANGLYDPTSNSFPAGGLFLSDGNQTTTLANAPPAYLMQLKQKLGGLTIPLNALMIRQITGPPGFTTTLTADFRNLLDGSYLVFALTTDDSTKSLIDFASKSIIIRPGANLPPCMFNLRSVAKITGKNDHEDSEGDRREDKDHAPS